MNAATAALLATLLEQAVALVRGTDDTTGTITNDEAQARIAAASAVLSGIERVDDAKLAAKFDTSEDVTPPLK